jgi:hypothetical protein
MKCDLGSFEIIVAFMECYTTGLIDLTIIFVNLTIIFVKLDVLGNRNK